MGKKGKLRKKAEKAKQRTKIEEADLAGKPHEALAVAEEKKEIIKPENQKEKSVVKEKVAKKPEPEKQADAAPIATPASLPMPNEALSTVAVPVLVGTTTAADNLTVLRRALSIQRCVLLSGGVGVGKTSMCKFLASEAKVDLVTVGLDSSVDIKDLVGTFRATSPGKFAFQYGPLAHCVQSGKWLVLEDMDLASSDVTSALVALLQTGELYIPEQDEHIQCHPNFRLLATVQTAVGGGGRRGVVPHQQLWGVVPILPQSMLEMFQCVASACPNVNHTALQAVKSTFETLHSVAQSEVADDVVLESHPDITHNEVKRLLPHVRLSLRELLRWGRRMMVRAAQCSTTSFLDTATKDLMYLEALDSFCRHLPESKGYSTMAKTIGAGLGISSEKQGYILEHHKPLVKGPFNGVLTVGRQELNVNEEGDSTHADKQFGDTKAALSLLERLAVCVKMIEPVLLTGETGVGKTYIVQHLANALQQNLVVHNLNQQSETSDIIGGYKPSDITSFGLGLGERARVLITTTYKNSDEEMTNTMLQKLAKILDDRKWGSLVKLIKKIGEKTLASLKKKITNVSSDAKGVGAKLIGRWTQLLEDASALDIKATMLKGDAAKGAFEFVEGSLVKSFREGHWLLLDEINLADAEILERISQAVEMAHTVEGGVISAHAKLTITERGGDEANITMHPNFRLFACMNPPTDVGKKDLPPSLKSRFTEMYCDELTDKADLRVVVMRLIGTLVPNAPVDDVVDFYLACREQAPTKLTDNDPSTPKPHYSLRTLTRALRFTRQVVGIYGFEHALLEGIYLCFYSQLSRPFQPAMNAIVSQYLLKGKRISNPMPPPKPSDNCVQFEHFWLETGSLESVKDNNYVITQSIDDHLRNLARVVVAGRAVLLQGPTAAGKTSMVEYLAKVTGHRCMRINNHETTDIQEYVGQYVSDDTGKLVFVEGALVTACRQGHWIILDELNLAPSEVLEALNRLLDDNRELFIPETMELIKPHPHFRLFATQNPPGIYGGRKQLSRAMRNRFMEILVDDIPHAELEIILSKRYDMPPTMAKKMVSVMTTLQTRRQSSAVFQGKHGFITPRDLFRWAERGPFTYKGLATHGMFLLGDRCRKPEEAIVVKHVLSDVIGETVPSDEERYNPLNYPQLKGHWEKFNAMMSKGGDLPESLGGGKIVPTKEFSRLFVLVGLCLHYAEPFVLVGETGGGKTTVCQLWGHLLAQELTVVNCHQHSETSDFLGAFRPATPQQREAGRLFTWVNGPLIESMNTGQLFMLDEVSLAEDAVLERLNSVFEPGRSITLPEKGEADMRPIKAAASFRVMATMNPAGDFGKKELSPALRNRMTEIHVTSLSKQPDLVTILEQRLDTHVKHLAPEIVKFLSYLQDVQGRMISIRDVMAVCRFASRSSAVNGPLKTPLSAGLAYAYAVDAILLAGLAIGTGMSESQAASIRNDSYLFLTKQAEGLPATLQEFDSKRFWEACDMPAPTLSGESKKSYSFTAPTTQYNISAILRVLWVLDGKAVLMEGSPGVGKTTLVQTLGSALGMTVVRFNLSEQTDMSDLVGTFLPDPTSKDGKASFRWSDGLLLQAMVNGWWVVLDELNLASQSVLEGLNALLDHRAELFIPELNKVFKPAKGFRVFGCQNPLAQGGGRKGLPKSFLNRFTRVWVNPFQRDDLDTITSTLYPDLSSLVLQRVVTFITKMDLLINKHKVAGRCGGPWEFNLRDICRWCEMLRDGLSPWMCCYALFVLRFRTEADRAAIVTLYEEVFEEKHEAESNVLVVDDSRMRLGNSFLPILKDNDTQPSVLNMLPGLPMTIGSMVTCLKKSSLVLLVGPSGAGKTSVIKLASSICSATVSVFPMSSGTDTVDLLGQFQQQDGSFVWHDSLLIKALEQGHWLVLDNANFASPTVLDRLNGLLEPNGDLVLNECGVGPDGNIRVIKPHPSFRLILTMDSRHGEVSRAMRNRGVELFIAPFDALSVHSTAMALASHNKQISEPDQVKAFAAALTTNIDDGARYYALAKWHCGHLERCFPMRNGDWGKVGTRALAPTMSTLMRCLDLVKLLKQTTSEGTAIKTAIHQCYLRGLNEQLAEKEGVHLKELCENTDVSWLSPAVAVCSFTYPTATSVAQQEVFFLLRCIALSLSRGGEATPLRKLQVVPHYSFASPEVRTAAMQQLCSYMPNHAPLFQLLNAALDMVPAQFSVSTCDLLRAIDITDLGIAPVPPASTADSGFASLSFASAIVAVLRTTEAAGGGNWLQRDKVLSALNDLAAATRVLQSSSRGENEKGAWRSAAGAAGALAHLIPVTASDEDVLSWLHCYLRLARACSKLPYNADVGKALSGFDTRVIQHFSLVGDLRSPLLWKKGGHPAPCLEEHYDAIKEAPALRQRVAQKKVEATEGVILWRHITTTWAVKCLEDVFSAQCELEGCDVQSKWSVLGRVASTKAQVFAVDCIPLKLAAEGKGSSPVLHHPLVESLLSRICMVDYNDDEDVEDEDKLLRDINNDRYARHMMFSPCQDMLHVSRELCRVSAEKLLAESTASMRQVSQALTACLVQPRWDKSFSVVHSMRRSAGLIIAATMKPFLADEPLRQAVANVQSAPTDTKVLTEFSEVALKTAFTDSVMAKTIKEYGVIASQSLAKCKMNKADIAINVGCSFALLGAWRLSLLQPTSPLDPAMRTKHKAEAAQKWVESRLQALTELRDIEDILNGERVSDSVIELTQHCDMLSADQATIASKAVHRRSRSENDKHDMFPALFWEVRQYVTSSLSPARMQRIVKSLQSVNDADSREAAARETSILAMAAERFAASIEKYIGYEDVVSPIRASASLVQLGLTLAMRAVPHVKAQKGKKRKTRQDEDEGAEATDILRTILPQTITLPTTKIPSNLTSMLNRLVSIVFSKGASEKDHWGMVNATVKSLRVFQDKSALAFTTATSCETATGSLANLQRDTLADSEAVYGAWVLLWDVIEAEEIRRAELAAEEVKWKENKTEIEGDDEALERTLRELFPDYIDEIADMSKSKKEENSDEEEEEVEKVDEATLSYDIQRVKQTLHKGELLDVVLQYVCMVSDSVKLRFTHASGDGVKALPKPKKKRARGAANDKVNKARMQLMATTEQLEEDALPEVPAPDAALASELLDAPSTDIVRKRLHPSALKERLGMNGIDSALSILATLDSTLTFTSGDKPGHAFLTSTTHVPFIAASYLSVKTANEAAMGSTLSDDVTYRIRTGFNIYREPDICEATHGLKALGPLRDRIAELIADFPEHPPLLKLQEITNSVLTLNPRTEPLMKILQGTELVLKSCHEWETSAHKGVSIATHIKSIGSAILRWRRLELHCWPHLLHGRRREKEENACRHAFTLWGLVNQVTSDEECNTVGLCDLVQKFVFDTSYAEFDLRVRLLATHGQRLALALADSATLSNEKSRGLCNLFLNTSAYFGTFLKEFQTTFHTDSKEIRRKLSEFIKIQRWEDANFYALTASTQKSHKQIAKFLRLWDAVLAKPMAPWMVRQAERLDERLVLPDEGGTVPPKPAPKKRTLKKGKKDAEAEAEKEKQEEEEAPMSPFAIAMNDATSCLSDEAAELSATTSLLTGATNVAYMVDLITSRVGELQPPSKEKMSVKQRSLKTLLETLQGEGLETRENLETWSEERMMTETNYSIELSLAAEGKNVWPAASGTRERLLWLNSERDFFRSIQAHKRMMSAFATPHADINDAQRTRIKIITAQLFTGIQHQRSETVPNVAKLLSALNTIFLTSGKEKSITRTTPEVVAFNAALREVCEVCSKCLKQALPLAQAVDATSGLSVEGSESMLHLEDAKGRVSLQNLVTSCTTTINSISSAKDGASIPGFISALEAQAQQLFSSADVSFVSGSAECIVQHCQDALKALACYEQTKDTDAGDVAAEVTAICNSIVQDASSGKERDTIMKCNMFCKSFDVKKAAATLQQAAPALAKTPESSPLWEVLTSAHRVVETLLRALIQFHCSSTRLFLVTTRLFGTLMKKGFCGKKEEEEEGEGEGEAGDFQEGTGMDEGEGKNDVSQEIENEDQLMSEKDMEKDDKEKEKDENKDDEDEEDTGVDVSTNFEGQLEDAKNDEDEDKEDEESSVSKEEGEVSGEDQEETKGEQNKEDDENLRDAEQDNKKEKMDDDNFTDEENPDEDENDSQEGGWDNEKLDDKMNEDDKGSQEGELKAKDNAFDEDGDSEEGNTADGDEDEAEKKDEDDSEMDEDDDKSEQGSEQAAQPEDAKEGSDEDNDGAEEEEKGDGQEIDPEEDDQEGEDAEMAGADIPDEQRGADQGIDDGRTGEDQTVNRDDDKQAQSKKGEEEQAPVDQMQDSATGETMTSAQKGARSQRQSQSDKKEKKETKDEKTDGGEQEERKPEQQSKREEAADPFKALGQLMEQMKEKMIRAEETGAQDDDADQDIDAEAAEYEIAPKAADIEQYGAAPVKEDEDMDMDLVEEEDFTKDNPEKPKPDTVDADEVEEEKEKDDDQDREEQPSTKQKQNTGKKTRKPGKVIEEPEDELMPEPEEEEEEPEHVIAAKGEALWNEIEGEVTPLAHELAQHLRLLLEPTKTDRLKGDYKTGKRLNMKKVISYIASGYKKDRIWMRRTKPSAREYQIIVAIDDSYSMSCNKAGSSALSALAVLTKALAIVEAGQVAVAKFGTDVDFIQTFDDPLTIDSASRTLGKFKFDQKETNIKALMESALQVLDEAKLQRGPASRQTSDLLQLMFILSDAKIQRQYRDDLKKLVNRAQENGQLIVFIILDEEVPEEKPIEDPVIPEGLTPAAELRLKKKHKNARAKKQYDSILSMVDVDYTTNGEVRMTPFMQGFPFPFYTVVNRLEQLPTTLSDALAQWFEAAQSL